MKKRIFEREGGRRAVRKRMALVALLFLVGFSALVYRCLYLHLARDPKLARIARSQYRTKVPEAPPRGHIYDALGEELAITVPAHSVAIRPPLVKDTEGTIRELSRVLEISPNILRSKMDRSQKYVWIKRHLLPREKDLLSKTLPGVEMVKESKRFYPNREVASQILGAVGRDNEGLGGLELFYDRVLKGEGSDTMAYRDARGRTFETEETLDQGKGGPYHLTLTLRKNIQYVTEKELTAACDRHQARACTAVVLDPKSGAILAMASYPTFNPNAYERSDLGSWRNVAVTDTFEPGSTFKPILAAAALEMGKVAPEDRFFCENGSLQIGKHIIHDHVPHGTLTLRDILKVSSNIGVYKVGRKVGKKGFSEMIHRFGFGKKTGIDFPGEVSGFVPPESSWMEIEFANLSFGQGIRVTPLQLASAFSAIANGGMRYRPTLVSRVTDSSGKTVFETTHEPVQRVMSEETSRRLLDLLKGVTEEGGTASVADLYGYPVAGKTGTAQKFVNGAYSHTKFVSSFVGMVPAQDPKLVALILIDEPKGVAYGGVVAAPVFRKIAWSALMDLGIAPQEQVHPILRTAGVLETSSLDPSPLKTFSGPGLPDFRGLSKRKVLALLEDRKITGEVIGAGIAVSQEPPPGSLLGKGEKCRIYFRPD